MSDEQEKDVPTQLVELLNEASQAKDKWYDHVVNKLKIPKAVADGFLCLRGHTEHAWGLAIVRVNGVRCAALIQPSNDSGTRALVRFITPIERDNWEVIGIDGKGIAEDGSISLTRDDTVN